MTVGAREQTGDDRFERLQQRIAKLESVISACPFVAGVRIVVSLTTTPTQVAHRLGRKPQGFLVMSATPSAGVGYATTQPSDQKSFINLVSTASTMAVLWVF